MAELAMIVPLVRAYQSTYILKLTTATVDVGIHYSQVAYAGSRGNTPKEPYIFTTAPAIEVGDAISIALEDAGEVACATEALIGSTTGIAVIRPPIGIHRATGIAGPFGKVEISGKLIATEIEAFSSRRAIVCGILWGSLSVILALASVLWDVPARLYWM